MGLFSKKPKDMLDGPGVIGSEDEILGSIDEVFRQRIPLLVRTREKRWVCNIYQLDVDRKVIRVEDSPGLLENNNAQIQCGFALDRVWFVFQSKLIAHEGKPYLLIPKIIKQSERRKSPRATFSLREKVAVSILESLGRGIGLTGTAVDISAEGLCLQIERALKLENEQKVNVHSQLLAKGTQLMIVKVKGISGVPTIEAEGIVNRISGPGGWKLALQFGKLPGQVRSAIERFVNSRYIQPNPIRRSYQKRLDMQKKREEEAPPEKESGLLQKSPANDLRSQRRGEIKFVDENFSTKDTELTPETKPQPDKPAQPEKPIQPFSPPRFTPPPSSPQTTAPSKPVENSKPVVDTQPSAVIPPIEPTPPLKDESLKHILLSLGDELKDSLSFLSEVTQYEWIHVDTPIKILKLLNDRNTEYILLPLTYKGQSMLEYLEKLTQMGVSKDINIILFTPEPLAPKDIIKCRILGIQHILNLPLELPKPVLDIISNSAPSQS